ncbi:phosphate ABC transporter substrate-binding protein PstS [Mycobacterium intermedium]|uniref:Phosphate-binding protein n=1 Tax=Mycobacterium intermedium TaxID=28445 RepID=A0A1E3SB65_MYCIE|nr:phosphate ABC transporter substrate-binding protein PstS [Mycobacterium intermedium]MCV6962311.1 phosphate ABC transporter substrate-binding protein PstS [Mycobacterium intermedium]ODQ99400.1 phosphate ABC transporter substrate-binding protein PstS [Mycobacterium intermedium]OPE51173.1 phosphate ABC transporter substrate-binding protein PstS [Mycobacterium intermedium]ORB00887.1 phosphate ABC transporter substrate-binding protein PstS [Mycobacterium intermedium]
MNCNRFGLTLSVIATAAVTLSACGSAAPTADPTQTPGVACGGKPTLKASGSTAQENAMNRFAKAFEQACPGQSMTYTGTGSAAGINEFISNRTDFAGSDAPLAKDDYAKAERRCGSPVWNLPVVFGPIVIAYNVTGLTSLSLDGPTAAKIFNGAITAWDDPAIAALNPGATLPGQPIRVVFRSDESGTSENFQRYLDTAGNGAWGKGAGKRFNGGVGEGATGNEGAAAAVANADGSITYVGWSFAQAHHLATARIITAAGPEPVVLSADSVGKTISGAWFAKEGNDLALDTISFYRPNQPGSYPIVQATYEVVCSKYSDVQTGTAVRAFLQSAISAGQNGLVDNGYAPVPDAFRSRLSTAVNAIS